MTEELTMSTYRDMLLRRAQKSREAQPAIPDKAMTLLQYRNHLNTRAWRDRFRDHRMHTP